MGRARRGTVLVWALLAAACGSSAASDRPSAEAHAAAQQAKPPAANAPVQHPDPSLPVSKRIQGKWRMDLSKVPDTALTEEFRKFKKRGKADSLLITYTVTDTEFALEAFGNGSIWRHRFDYEILREEGDTLLLKKIEPDKTSEIGVVLRADDQLIIGAGNGQVPMQRVSFSGAAPALRGGSASEPEPKR